MVSSRGPHLLGHKSLGRWQKMVCVCYRAVAVSRLESALRRVGVRPSFGRGKPVLMMRFKERSALRGNQRSLIEQTS